MRRPRRLSTILVLSLVALFLVVTAVTAITTVVVTRQQLVAQIDARLLDQAHLVAGPGPGLDPPRRPGTDPCTTPLPGVGEGGLQACSSETSTTGHIVSRGAYQELSADQVASVLAAGSGPATVELASLGTFRVVAAESGGTTVVTGAPMTTVDDAVTDLVRTMVLVSLVGTVLTALGGTWLVSRSLRPLRSVAATARDVSAMDLARGEVHLPDRVPADVTNGHTEVSQVGRALNSLLENVGTALTTRQRSETRLRTFVADASHELRTPLASIRGYAELSRRQDQEVPEQVRLALGRIESEAGRMTVLVEDLLLLARLDAGRELERAEVDLSAMVVESVSDALAMGPEHRWEIEVPAEPVTVTGDAARLKQVLSNLLGNARNHTPAGTRVVTSLTQSPQEVLLSVVDDGPGIPEEQWSDLFERFTRGDASRHRATGSTGLGLSIAKAVVTAHGGRIELDPSHRGGAAFRVHLPRASTAADGPAPGPARPTPRPARSDRPR